MTPWSPEFAALLGTTLVISLSGVLMPGPVFASAVARGYENPWAGTWIALGHAVVEFPLIYLIYLGFGYVFKGEIVSLIIGVVGGALLIVMGVEMVRIRSKPMSREGYLNSHPILIGIITSINPYFVVWWATVGMLLVYEGYGTLPGVVEFGLAALLIFMFTHWLVDLVWVTFVSHTVYRSRRFITPRAQAFLFGTCGLMIAFFGMGFALFALLADRVDGTMMTGTLIGTAVAVSAALIYRDSRSMPAV